MTTDIKRAAIVGCGRQRGDGVWRGMSRQHARGYAANGVEIVAVADIDEGNARAFVEQAAPDAAVFDDFARMARDARPDVVSVCTWPHLHAPMVISLAEVGVPAVHCEKPMATTWGDAKRMVEACDAGGTRLTIGHQRRFSPTLRAMKDTIDSGHIGRVLRIEGRIDNLYDWGHALVRRAAVPDRRRRGRLGAGGGRRLGAEDGFRGGVRHERGSRICAWPAARAACCSPAAATSCRRGCRRCARSARRARSSSSGTTAGGVRARTDGGWEAVEVADRDVWADAIGDVVNAAREGRESLLSAANALRGTELMFAAYHSARLHGRARPTAAGGGGERAGLATRARRGDERVKEWTDAPHPP